MNEYVRDLYNEVTSDIMNETRGLYDAGSLITLINLLIYDYGNVVDYFHMGFIDSDDCAILTLAIKSLINKMTRSLYCGNYRDFMWLNVFDELVEDKI